MPQNYVSHVYNYVLHTFAMHLEFMVKGHKAIMSFNTYLIAVVILCQRSQILNCPFCTIEVGQRPWLFIYQVNFSFIFSINPFCRGYGVYMPDLCMVFCCLIVKFLFAVLILDPLISFQIINVNDLQNWSTEKFYTFIKKVLSNLYLTF